MAFFGEILYKRGQEKRLNTIRVHLAKVCRILEIGNAESYLQTVVEAQ